MDEAKDQPKIENSPINSISNASVKNAAPVLGWVVSIILIVTVMALSVFSIQLKIKNKELANYKNEVETEKMTQKKAITQGNELFKVLTPRNGDILCLGKPNEISWSVPPGVETVVASLDTSVTFNRIGEYPAIKNVENGIGKGSVLWNMKNEGGYPVVEGDVYKITLTANYQGQQIRTTSDGIFSVGMCQGSTCTKDNSCKFRTVDSEFRCNEKSEYSEIGSFLCICNDDCDVVTK